MADERTYIKVHDGIEDHPKTGPLSDKAFRLLVTTWAWCSRHRTDGRVPNAVWAKRGTLKARAELVAAGLAEPGNGHVAMHDYLEHQSSAEEIAEKVEAKRRGGVLGNHKRWHLGMGKYDPDCPLCVANGSDDRSEERSLTDRSGTSEDRSRSDRKTSPYTDTDTDTERSSAPNGAGGEPPRDTTQTIVAEWIDRCAKRPPGNVIGQLSKQVKTMLEEGQDPDDIRRGIAGWMAKGLHPSSLPSVVNEVMNRPRDSPNAGYQSPTDQRIAELLAGGQQPSAPTLGLPGGAT